MSLPNRKLVTLYRDAALASSACHKQNLTDPFLKEAFEYLIAEVSHKGYFFPFEVHHETQEKSGLDLNKDIFVQFTQFTGSLGWTARTADRPEDWAKVEFLVTLGANGKPNRNEPIGNYYYHIICDDPQSMEANFSVFSDVFGLSFEDSIQRPSEDLGYQIRIPSNTLLRKSVDHLVYCLDELKNLERAFKQRQS